MLFDIANKRESFSPTLLLKHEMFANTYLEYLVFTFIAEYLEAALLQQQPILIRPLLNVKVVFFL